MPDNNIRILNFDNSLIQQKDLIKRFNPQIINLLDIGPQCRLWMSEKIKNAISSRINTSNLFNINFIGSGDFHHISTVLLSGLKESFSLVIFDHHPDWDSLPPHLGCGSWVSYALRDKNILKCFLIGVSSEDISTKGIQTADISLLKENRLAIYPYYHKPSRLFLRKIPRNISIDKKEGVFSTQINWIEIGKANLNNFMESLIKYVPSDKIYISIDKDCLKNEHAVTNWEEGSLNLDELLGMLKFLKDKLEIIGVDIVGDYSEVVIKDKFKAFLSRLDHPREGNINLKSQAKINSINESTNIKIIETLIS